MWCTMKLQDLNTALLHTSDMDRISQVTLLRNKGGDCVTALIAGEGRKLRALELISFLCSVLSFLQEGTIYPE